MQKLLNTYMREVRLVRAREVQLCEVSLGFFFLQIRAKSLFCEQKCWEMMNIFRVCLCSIVVRVYNYYFQEFQVHYLKEIVIKETTFV